MKKTYLAFKALVIALALTFTSCSSLLDIEPRQSIDSATALRSEEAINAAVNGVYDRLQGLRYYGRDLIALPEALSDNGRATGKSGRLVAEFQNQPNAHFGGGLWQISYYAINQINLILEALPSVEMSAANKDAVEGQMLTLRALFYFNMARVFAYDPGAVVDVSNRGSVPLLLVGTLRADAIELPARAPIDAVYNQIYQDLERGIEKLAGTANNRGPVYITRAAARALFSRVALYRKDYANAIRYATDAIGSGVGTFLSNSAYVGGFRTAVNPESIFEINYQNNENLGVNESLQSTYTTLVTLGNRAQTGGFGDLVPTASLLADFETGDIRRQLYELGTAGRGTAETECTKFLGKNGQINLDNIPVIRFSELYLNRAEAYAMPGPAQNEALALEDLNRIRTRAGLAAVTGLSGQALINEILKQRRVELAFEGHRFFDLKRRGQNLVKTPLIEFTDFRILAPLPVREILANPNLVQNPGY